ncbi:MAG: HAMP domain-containing sensor histidine kinase [Anaerolineales bacterium]
MNNYHFNRSFRKRPKWWPENEPWPPHRRVTRRHFLRRIGCFFVLFILFGLAILGGIFVLAARGLGWTNFPFGPGQRLIPSEVFIIPFVIMLLVLGGMVLRRLVVPLDDLLKAADKVGQGDYSARVQEKGSREIRSLARAFNNMASRLTINDAQRRELLADVTHELRTPLTVVQGNLEGMLDGIYPPDEPNLRSLLEETNILSRLVEDLRTLALAESGAIQLKKEPVDLSMLIKDILAAFKTQADSAGVSLIVETSDDLPWLNLDPGRIRQVLSNLVANALRYTPSGGMITIYYRQADRKAIMEVQDSGPGIPLEELPHVFERFYKSADSGGMGLGLAIARHLVEAHEGMITAESTLGHGTTMRIILPMGE